MHDQRAANLVANQRRGLMFKVIFVAALLILIFTFIHLYSLRHQISDLHEQQQSADNNNGDRFAGDRKNHNFLEQKSIASGGGDSSESYSEYSKRAFSNFPAGNSVPKMRQHVIHLQITPANSSGPADHLDLEQKVLLDEGGRKVPNIVGNPVPVMSHKNNNNNKNIMNKLLSQNNNNNKNNEQPQQELRVFSVKPYMTGSLEWIPDFVNTDKGNIVFKDKNGNDDSVNWFTAEVKHENLPPFPTRFMLLQKINFKKDLFKFFQKEIAFERENTKDSSAVSFFVDAHQYVINKNPSQVVRDNLEMARFKIASVLGMPLKVLSHTFIVSSLSKTTATTNGGGDGDANQDGVEDNNNNGKVDLNKVPVDIATNLYDQIELIVDKVQKENRGKKEKNTDVNQQQTTFAASSSSSLATGPESYEGLVVAVSVSALYKNPLHNEAAILYWRGKEMNPLSDDMLEDHSIKILTDFIVGTADSMKNKVEVGGEGGENNNNNNNNIVGEDDGGIVIRNFLIVCAIVKA